MHLYAHEGTFIYSLIRRIFVRYRVCTEVWRWGKLPTVSMQNLAQNSHPAVWLQHGFWEWVLSLCTTDSPDFQHAIKDWPFLRKKSNRPGLIQILVDDGLTTAAIQPCHFNHITTWESEVKHCEEESLASMLTFPWNCTIINQSWGYWTKPGWLLIMTDAISQDVKEPLFFSFSFFLTFLFLFWYDT